MALRHAGRLRRQVQRQSANGCVPRGLPPEVDSYEYRGPLPRSPRHYDRALPQRSLADGHAEPPAGLGGPWNPRDAAGRDRNRRVGEEQSFVQLLSESGHAGRSYGSAVPVVLADLGHDHAHRVPLVRAGLGWWTNTGLVERADRQLRPYSRGGPSVRRGHSTVDDVSGFQGHAAELPGAAHLPLARGAGSAHRGGADPRALAGEAFARPVLRELISSEARP